MFRISRTLLGGEVAFVVLEETEVCTFFFWKKKKELIPLDSKGRHMSEFSGPTALFTTMKEAYNFIENIKEVRRSGDVDVL